MPTTFNRIATATAAVVLGLFSQAEAAVDKPTTATVISVATTIMPLADWVKNVGGDAVVVTTLIPAGASPHTFEPKPTDMRRAAGAQVVFRVGLEYDDWALKMVPSRAKGRVVALGDVLKKQSAIPDVCHVQEGAVEIASKEKGATSGHNHGHDHSHGHSHDHGTDPHYWLDPMLAQASLKPIVEALSAQRPDLRITFEENAKRYGAELQSLDAELSASISLKPVRPVVTFHNAFAYMANRYNFRVAGVIEEFPGKVPTDRYIMDISRQLRKEKISVIFAEPQFNPRAAEVLAKEIGGRVDILDPLGHEDFSDRDTFVKLLRYNVAKLQEASALPAQ
jgi:zinc transport system substrate-binding protein